MLAILQFVFSSFWVWAGTVVLLSIVTVGTMYLLVSLLSVLPRR